MLMQRFFYFWVATVSSFVQLLLTWSADKSVFDVICWEKSEFNLEKTSSIHHLVKIFSRPLGLLLSITPSFGKRVAEFKQKLNGFHE